MITRCTSNLLSRLKDQPGFQRKGVDSLWSCHVDIFQMERRLRLLVTNDLTMFTIFIPEFKPNDFPFLDFTIGRHLLRNLLYENIPHDLIRVMLTECSGMAFQKASDPGALSIINSLRTKFEHLMRAHGGLESVDYYELNSTLNRLTLKGIERNCPIDLLKKRLVKYADGLSL